MKVSIIVTNYNYSLYVEQCLESIFCQDYNDIELIVIDDTSKDNSLEVINRVLDSYKWKNIKIIKAYNEENLWLRNSCLKWLEISSWDLVMRIDADDFLVGEDSISHKVKLFQKNKQLWFVYSSHITVDDRSKAMNNFFYHDFEEDFVWSAFDKIVLWNKIISSGTLVNKKYEDYIRKYIWDWDLWLFLSKDYEIWFIAKAWIAYRIHSRSMSKQIRTEGKEYNKKNQGIEQNDYPIMHGFDLVNEVFWNWVLNKKQKKLKKKALAWCYRFWFIYLLKAGRYIESLKYLFFAFCYDMFYFIRNFVKIFYILFHNKKI